MRAKLLYADQGPELAKYRQSRKFFAVIRGPLGSAKTTTSIQRLIELIVGQKPNKKGERRSRWAVVRNTYPDLINTTIRDFKQIIEPLGIATMTMGHPPEARMDFDLPDGTRVVADVVFIALDKDDDVRKLRGMQLTGAWVNEMKEIPKSVIDMLQGRVDRYPTQGSSAWVGVFGDTNAWDSDHWLETIAEGVRQGKYGDYDVFVQPGAVIRVDGEWVVNPLRENTHFVGEAYYQRQLEGKRPDWINVNLANEVGYYVDGRPVHEEYADTIHCAKAELIPHPGLIRVGLDFGLTPAAAFMQRQNDGQWWVFDEVVIEDGDTITLADRLKSATEEWIARVGMVDGQSPFSFVYRGDPSGDSRAQTDSSTPYAVLRGQGVNAFPASSNDPVIRRAALDRPLTRAVKGRPGILVSPRCRVIRKGLAGGYHYKRVTSSLNDGRFRDVPDKNIFSHVCEALEYGLMDGGEHAVINPTGREAKPMRAVTMPTAWNPFNV